MDREKRKIPIKNILYMFSYIWNKAEYIDFNYLNDEDDFESVNILSKLFLENINSLMKKGIYKEYIEKNEETKRIKGKVDFSASIRMLSLKNAKAVCSYDELEEDNVINQIIKTTAYKLYKSEDICNEYKRKLNNVLLYFNGVSIIDINKNTFNINFNKNNYYTYFMICICKLINESSMLSENPGKFKFINILDDDEKMHQVFELFVYKFYKKNLKNYDVYYQKKLEWNLFGRKEEIIPQMRLDIVIENESDIIVIDTKYYGNIFNSNYYSLNNKRTIISDHLYQIYTYMNHIETYKNLEGILLYPYNEDEISEKYDTKTIYKDGVKRSKIRIQTIDLSQDWRNIEKEMLEIVNFKSMK